MRVMMSLSFLPEVDMKRNLKIVFLSSLLVGFINVTQALGQPHQQPSEAPMAQRNFGGDPIRQLNLTPEQREQIRSIREQGRAERTVVNQRLGEASRALEEVLDSDSPDETVVEQRMREVAAAQAAAMRLRILTEVKIRRVLTSEQRTLLRTMRHQAHRDRRERRLDAPAERLRRREERNQRVQERRNSMAPRGDAQAKPTP